MDQSGFSLILVSATILRISVRKICRILSRSQSGTSGDNMSSSSHEEADVISEHTDEISESLCFCGLTTVDDDGDDVTMATDCNGASPHAKLGIVNVSEHGVNESSPLDNILLLSIICDGSNDTAKGSRKSYLACSMSLVCEF